MPDEVGLERRKLMRFVTHYEKMMKIASHLREREADELGFWTLKRERWMRRTIIIFPQVYGGLLEISGKTPFFTPDIALLKVLDRAEVVRLAIIGLVERHDQLIGGGLPPPTVRVEMPMRLN